MSAEGNNVSPLDRTGKGTATPAIEDEETYVGARCSVEQKRRYNKAWAMGEYPDRSAFILAACDALATTILGPAPTSG